MADGDCIEDKQFIPVNEPGNKVTYCQGPRQFKVLGEADEYYVIEIDGKPGAVEKSRCKTIVISAYIT